MIVFEQIVFDFVIDVVNIFSEYLVEKIYKLVVENGGIFFMNLSSIVIYVVVFEKKGMKFF